MGRSGVVGTEWRAGVSEAAGGVVGEGRGPVRGGEEGVAGLVGGSGGRGEELVRLGRMRRMRGDGASVRMDRIGDERRR